MNQAGFMLANAILGWVIDECQKATPVAKKSRPGWTREVKYPGIMRDARELGVSRTQLWYVLEGERESKSLLRRYRALKAQQAQG